MLVGRGAERARLHHGLAEARAGRGCAYFVTGESGVGKTRLASDAVSAAIDAGMAVLRGRASRTGPAVAFRPLTEALMTLARGGSAELVSRLGPYRRVLGRLVPDWADGGPPEPVSLVVLAEGVLRLTALAGEGVGCLLVLDDLQDADVETLAVVDYLCSNLTGLPTMLLATVRDEPSEALDLAGTVSHRGDGVLLPLDRLDRAEVDALVASCLETDPAQVPGAVTALLYEQSAGNPLVVEELLSGALSSGELVRGVDGWRFDASARGGGVPPTLVSSVVRRVQRLGPTGVRLLSVAAVLGPRFPLPVVQLVTGLDDHVLLGNLQAAVAAGLLSPDDTGPDWYAFQHPLTVEALLSSLPPAEQASLCGRAADAITRLHPDLPGEWCPLVASLRLREGRRSAAGQLYLRAGRLALLEGAPGSAVALLEQAEPLLADDADRVELLQVMLYALAENGQFDVARGLAARLRDTTTDTARQIEVAVRLAWAAHVAGRWEDGAEQVRAARALLPPDADEQQTVLIDAVDAYLTLFNGERDGVARAEELARAAVAGAERVPLPATACQAWYAIGLAARERDLDESNASFRRMLDVAEQHELTIWRLYALTGLGGNAWLAEADTSGLERARAEALRTGGITLARNVEAILALHAVLMGDFELAERQLAACLDESRRMHLAAISRYALMAKAALAGHRGDSDGMRAAPSTRGRSPTSRLRSCSSWTSAAARVRAALAEFAVHGGVGSPEEPLVRGLAQAFCALLEEDLASAEAHLDGIGTGRQQSTFYLSGTYGLKLLLDVLAGRAGWAEHDAVSTVSAGRMRWNRQFVRMAAAVLLGREGQRGAAEVAWAEAMSAAEPFRTARALGQRLVAAAAAEDGWGEPDTWLRAAEDHFHRAGVPAVASACRSLLRRAGATVGQRRVGVDRVPEVLRRRGVTVREYEVYELLVHRLGNKALAARLHISPRTVEKHVASLLAKTALPDRSALVEHAAAQLRGARGGDDAWPERPEVRVHHALPRARRS